MSKCPAVKTGVKHNTITNVMNSEFKIVYISVKVYIYKVYIYFVFKIYAVRDTVRKKTYFFN